MNLPHTTYDPTKAEEVAEAVSNAASIMEECPV